MKTIPCSTCQGCGVVVSNDPRFYCMTCQTCGGTGSLPYETPEAKAETAVCTQGKPPTTIPEVLAIVAAEYKYWSDAPELVQIQAMGGTGACANILCAVNGFRAPWHPKPKK